MSFPRRPVSTVLSERSSDMVALYETVLAVRVTVVTGFFLIAELLCHQKHTTHRIVTDCLSRNIMHAVLPAKLWPTCTVRITLQAS